MELGDLCYLCVCGRGGVVPSSFSPHLRHPAYHFYRQRKIPSFFVDVVRVVAVQEDRQKYLVCLNAMVRSAFRLFW